VAERKLTPKQQKFVAEYLIDLNATQAAIRAGYSARTARNIANELLTKPHIQAELQKRRGKIEKKLEISQEAVISELAAIIQANGADYAKIVSTKDYTHVEFTPTDELSPDKLKAIASIKESQNGMEVKLQDKLRAIELLGKFLGWFEKSDSSDNGPSLADTVTAAYQRRKEMVDNDNK
jgi:phage terminase small subunit